MQTFGGSINGSGQTGRPPTHNRQIIKAGLGARAQPNFLCDVGGYTLKKLWPVGEEHHGEIGRLWTESFQEALGFWIIGGKLDVSPLIGGVVARQEVAQLVRSGRPAGAQHPDPLKGWPVRSMPVIEQVIQLRIQV